MDNGFLLLAFAAAAAMIYFLISYLVLTIRAREMIGFLGEYGRKSNADPFFENFRDSWIYFGRASVFGKSLVHENGISLWSQGRFNVDLSWGVVAAVRVVKLKEKSIANLRVITSEGHERKLSFDFDEASISLIPSTVTIIRG